MDRPFSTPLPDGMTRIESDYTTELGEERYYYRSQYQSIPKKTSGFMMVQTSLMEAYEAAQLAVDAARDEIEKALRG